MHQQHYTNTSHHSHIHVSVAEVALKVNQTNYTGGYDPQISALISCHGHYITRPYSLHLLSLTVTRACQYLKGSGVLNLAQIYFIHQSISLMALNSICFLHSA